MAQLLILPKIETCRNCDREWPSRFGDHNCNFQKRSIHNSAIVIDPGAELYDSIDRLTGRMESELCRSAESADLAGEEPPYRDALADIDRTIGYLKHFRAEIQRLAGHTHRWNENDYCDLCGADGRA
jgi:hypothetical protein